MKPYEKVNAYIETINRKKLQVGIVDTFDWEAVDALWRAEGGKPQINGDKNIFIPKNVNQDLIFPHPSKITPEQAWDTIKWFSTLSMSELRTRQRMVQNSLVKNYKNIRSDVLDDAQMYLELLAHAVSLKNFGQLNFMY
jgi:hypothetical protein